MVKYVDVSKSDSWIFSTTRHFNNNDTHLKHTALDFEFEKLAQVMNS